MRSSNNQLDPDQFDDIYLKGMEAIQKVASGPSQRALYARGFKQAIDLYHEYFQVERITPEEAERRVEAILDCLLDGSATKTFGHRRT